MARKVYDSEAEKQAAYRDRKRTDAEQSEGRDKAIVLGRALGEHEARARGEVGPNREDRIKRAASYAAWEYDGKPEGRSADYHREFGLRLPDVVSSFDRKPFVRLISE